MLILIMYQHLRMYWNIRALRALANVGLQKLLQLVRQRIANLEI